MIQYLESFNLFTPDEIATASQFARKKKLKKGDFLIREGTVCSEVAILHSGILRSYYLTETGSEITYCFLFPSCFVTAYSSFISGKASPESIQAISPTELSVFQKKDIDALTESSTNWLKLRKQLAEQSYIEFENRIFSFQKEKAIQRYKELLKNEPEYILQIPQQYLASYLGITPRHLSRIRREIQL
jgi:CRP-like cAMP-binding protein